MGEDWRTALGARAKAVRKDRGLTLKALSEASGLSVRFLSEVEAGRANPSVGSLFQLAKALGISARSLLPEDRPRTVALLGIRGAGKSTVGARLAARLRRPFVELDRLIERDAGMELGDLFEIHGEERVGQIEERVLERVLAEEEPCVLATGGGLVTHPASWALLEAKAITVWLKATPQEHWDRVIAQGDLRPMQNRRRARAEFEALYAARAPLYARAELIVDTTRKDVDGVCREIALALQKGGRCKAKRSDSPPLRPAPWPCPRAWPRASRRW